MAPNKNKSRQGASPTQENQAGNIKKRLTTFFIFALALLITSKIDANPQGGSVASGNVTITTPAPNTVQITQTSDKGIINWQSFNIAANEKTVFVQPSASSMTLNRINPAMGASQIYGTLSANGQVILINAAGIHFGSGAMVNVGGLIASTSDISDANFLAGNYNFNIPSTYNGSIVNEGTLIAAHYGLIALLGNNIQNNGLIKARLGSVVLGSGSVFTLDFYGDQLINFTVDQAATSGGGTIQNTGTLMADGGQILVTASAAADVVDSVIDMQGVAQANSVDEKNGEIILSGGSTGVVQVSGELDAEGTESGSTGGTVKVLGNEIGLLDNAKINVSGDAGGGTALIGGNSQGLGPEPDSQYTYFSQTAAIDADALTTGNGGKVVIWSDGATYAYGSISARGGSLSGNGGSIETSGKYLDANGIAINLSAANGTTGNWLLDPANIEISDTELDINITLLAPFQPVSLILTNTTVSTLSAATLGLALSLGNATVETSPCFGLGTCTGSLGTINLGNSGTLNSLVSAWGSASTTLTLIADDNILLTAPLNVGTLGNKSIVMSAGNTTTSGGVTISSPLDGNIALTITAGSTGSNAIDAVMGGINALTSVNISGPTTISANITTSGTQTYNGAVTIGANALLTTANSGVTFDGTVDGANSLTIAAGLGAVNFDDAVGTTTALTDLISTGSGTVTFDGAVGSASQRLSSVAITGATDIDGGAVYTDGNQTYSGDMTLGAPTVLDTGPGTTSTLSLAAINGAGFGLTLDTAGTATQSGIFSNSTGNSSLTVGGTGTVVLSQANTYSGITTIAAGTLDLTSMLGLGNSSGITVESGGTLNLGFSNGAIANINTISLNGTGANGSGALTMSGSNDTVNNPLNIAGSSEIGGAGTGTLTLAGLISGVGANVVIDMNAAAVSLSALTLSGSGNVNVTAAGDITINGAMNTAGDVTLVSNGTITLNNTITGGNLTLSDQIFTNNAGSSALNPESGDRFLVYSVNPADDIDDGLVYNFKQYDIAYPTAPAASSGNGLLYTIAPILTPSLTGSVSRDYNATTTAPVTSGNYTVTGLIDGDTVTLTQSSANYDNQNAGTEKNVAVSGVTIASATDGSATVYGYQLSTTSVNANIGTILPAPITISSEAGQTKVYGNDDPLSAETAYAVTSGTLFGTDSLTGDMGRVAGESVGAYNFLQNTVSIADGNGGNNYVITFNGSTNPFLITVRSLAASIANQSKTYGEDDPTLPDVELSNVVDRSVEDINGNITVINDTTQVGVTLSSLTREAGEAVGTYQITGAVLNALTGSAASNYSAPVFTAGETLTINKANLTGSIASQSKVYGADDPALSGISVTLNGVVDRTVSTWNGTVAINDTGNVATTLSTLTRDAGEDVGSYNITAAEFTALTGSAAGNYNAPTLASGSTLTITRADLTGSIADQSKTYGADDPSLSGIGVTLNGLVDRTVSTWDGNVTVNDTGNVAVTLSSLARVAGESVGDYDITAATFNALTGVSANNYNMPGFSGGATLTINPANLTGSIASQSKVYGADDPALSGIGVTLNGVIDRTVNTWNGTVAINDTGNVATTLSALTRDAGEDVGTYNITAAEFTALTGSAAGNYNAPLFASGSTLTINKADLTGSIADQSKTYGADDPSLSGIGVTLNGLIDRTVSTWDGNVTVNDTGNVAATLSSLARVAGESVGDYDITAATFNALTGVSANNYNMPVFSGGATLTINKANLTASIADQSKTVGDSDPAASGINVTLNGLIDRTVSTWNGDVAVDDVGNAVVILSSLTRQSGETAGNYNYTAAVFNALTGSAAGNYNAPTLSGSPILTINAANATTTPTPTPTPTPTSNPATTPTPPASPVVAKQPPANVSNIINGAVQQPPVNTTNGAVMLNSSATITVLPAPAEQPVSANNTGGIAAVIASLETVLAAPLHWPDLVNGFARVIHKVHLVRRIDSQGQHSEGGPSTFDISALLLLAWVITQQLLIDRLQEAWRRRRRLVFQRLVVPLL